MRILCIYFLREFTIRNTIDEHLYSFRRYSNEECYYLNAAFGIPWYLHRIQFDLVIYHYTFLGMKWCLNEFRKLQKKWESLRKLKGYKIAIPQDEYIHSAAVSNFFRDFGVKTVFTCLPPSEYKKVYPQEKSGLEHYVTVTTGYIDELALEEIEKVSTQKEKTIDIGYRARKVPYWLGKHGKIKWQLAENFKEAAKAHQLAVDISCEPDDVFMGKEWYGFLQRSRVFLGCEGGASLLDATGDIRQKVEEYVHQHPDASFEDVEATCFPGLDGNLRLFALSPRHYECCITKTCQALVEGEYNGILKPGVHYIVVKKDWSNIEEVLIQIADVEYCEQLAENAYRDIVQSGFYTYRGFVEKVLKHVRGVNNVRSSYPDTDNTIYLKLLRLREKLNLISLHLLRPYYKMRGIAVRSKAFVSKRLLGKI